MKRIVLDRDNNKAKHLYEQLYLALKEQILMGEMEGTEKCPSIRELAQTLEVSVTTIMQAYNQLLAEGYIYGKAGSGYYVERGFSMEHSPKVYDSILPEEELGVAEYDYLYDTEVFDFVKWKKCANKVFTEYSDALLFGSDLKGEYSLRYEIAQYLHRSRGVSADPANIVISAGTQQIAFHLGRILKRNQVGIVVVEKPGYAPVKSMFEDASFQVLEIPVTDVGIDISMLPVNLKTSVYVSPSNQFPTGVVMPANKRYEILEWAKANHSYIIEDDYNSELRYFGQPLPPIKGLDTDDLVIYLGSFSSTLFPAIKISYMVLPGELTRIFDQMENTYTQTCSKAEQLTLAQFMKEGYYYTTIKKKRSYYTKKLQASIAAFQKYGKDFLSLTNQKSGITLTIKVQTDKSGAMLLEQARQLGVRVTLIEALSKVGKPVVSLYYSEIPLEKINETIKKLCKLWSASI